METIQRQAGSEAARYGHPTGHVLYRRGTHQRPMVARGEGVYLYDADGRRYLDASGGAIVVNLGHGVREVVQAMEDQAARVAYAHPTTFTSLPMETYAEALARVTGLPDARLFPLCSGSEAVETAIKLARQAQLARGYASRFVTISRWQSYHGTTLGALAVTGKPKMRRPFEPLLPPNRHIPPPYCYRCPYGLHHPGCGIRCAEALAEEIVRIGEENVAAFIAESVSGATLGAVVPPPGYWPRLRKICDEHGVLLIVDEVMAGFGRTGRWFGFQHWDIMPDVVTMGKGATGGYFPLSITAVRGEWIDAITEASGGFVHGGTFSHHPVGAAAGLAALRYMERKNLVAAAASKGEVLGEKLHAGLGDLPWIGDIRGIGLLWGLEFVADRKTKAPFPPSWHFAQRLADIALEIGLIVYPSGGCVDGTAGDHITIGPPFVITDEQIDEMVVLLRDAVEQAATVVDV